MNEKRVNKKRRSWPWFLQVVRETGLFRESFSDDDLNFDNMKDKFNKLMFLKKLINIVGKWILDIDHHVLKYLLKLNKIPKSLVLSV